MLYRIQKVRSSYTVLISSDIFAFFHIEADSSDFVIGVVLSQASKEDGK